MPPEDPTRSQHGVVAIADIVDSTALYERLGNSAARSMVEASLQILREETESHGGRVVKHLGDGLLCAFDSEQEALIAAIRMCTENEERGLPIRVGVNCGEMIEDAGDIFGDAVNTTARIAALAKPFEVMISGELAGVLPPELRALARPVPRISVKGKKEPLTLFGILVEKGGVGQGSVDTLFDASVTTSRSLSSLSASLELVFCGETITLQPGSELDIGRDSSCAITIPSRRASRLHARIYMRRGRFVLVDQSANGTYLVSEHRSTLHLRREEAPLFDSGSIFIGENPDIGGVEPILYRRVGHSSGVPVVPGSAAWGWGARESGGKES